MLATSKLAHVTFDYIRYKHMLPPLQRTQLTVARKCPVTVEYHRMGDIVVYNCGRQAVKNFAKTAQLPSISRLFMLEISR